MAEYNGPRNESVLSKATQQQFRVRKRTPNACNRCRQQKIKCSGTKPCGQCTKRKLTCSWDERPEKVFVSKSTLSDLQYRASLAFPGHFATVATQGSRQLDSTDSAQSLGPSPPQRTLSIATLPEKAADVERLSGRDAPRLGIELDPDSDDEVSARSNGDDEQITNPLVHGTSAYTTDTRGRPSYLGTSSNWSFARRVLIMVHAKVSSEPLPAANLLFEGSTYELGWDGRRNPSADESATLPTTDFALFLINAVKFHCTQLFHLFDEEIFMSHFSKFHETSTSQRGVDELWYVHYLLVLALGKAIIVRRKASKIPPGADLFTQGMKTLPDITLLCSNALQSIEILCCAALYLQGLDMRAAAYNLIGQAMRMAIADGLHTDMESSCCTHPEATLERCRRIWWTIYVLDCHMSSLMGSPITLAEQHMSTRLPNFIEPQRSLATKIHVNLATTIALISRTVYTRNDDRSAFLASIKTVLKRLAEISDERTTAFPLDVKDNSTSISRLAAHLHLFHHQCIILTIRPLLFRFWQKRLESFEPIRITSAGGVRSLLRVCIASARQTMNILTALQDQGLLESFIAFDLESVWSAAVVLSVTNAIDPSMLRHCVHSLEPAYMILDEMIARGNLIADARKHELIQLQRDLDALASWPRPSVQSNGLDTMLLNEQDDPDNIMSTGSGDSALDLSSLMQWETGNGLSGGELEAVANLLDFNQLDWLTVPMFDFQ